MDYIRVARSHVRGNTKVGVLANGITTPNIAYNETLW